MSHAVSLLDDAAIEYQDLKYHTLLNNVQGNILKGHGRNHTVHMLVKFDKQKRLAVFRWLYEFAKEKLTSCHEQLRQRELYKRNKVDGALFGGIYLTAPFYEDFEFDLQKFDANAAPFIEGMHTRAGLNDDVACFEKAYRDQPVIHAMILLGHDDFIALNEASAEVCASLSDYQPHRFKEPTNKIAEIITIEYGAAIRNASGDGLEHFGYVDGTSQPLFLHDDLEEFKKNNPSHQVYDPSAPLNLVLVPDPLEPEGQEAHGSYFVFRKLEQHVRQFKLAEEQLAKDLDLKGEDKERVGAMLFGRFEDGTPLTLLGTDKMIASGVSNGFDYDSHPQGLSADDGSRCPFHAHIRKMNPRTAKTQANRIARRGITYGYRNVSTTVDSHHVQMPTEGVGLLFMCFQANIANQFEKMQILWANNASFPNPKPETKHTGIEVNTKVLNPTGIDPIIGQLPVPPRNPEDELVCKEQNEPQSPDQNGWYPTKHGDIKSVKQKQFGSYVKMRGGAYFFAPSIPFLMSLYQERH